MRKALLTSVAAVAITGLLSLISSVWAACNPLGNQTCCETISCNSNGVLKKEEIWEAWFEPNYNMSTGFGYRFLRASGSALNSSCPGNCYPDFDLPTAEHGIDSSGRPTWIGKKRVHNKGFSCERIGSVVFETAKYTCSSLAEEEEECDSNGGAWNFNTNTCDGSGGCVDYVCVPRTCTGGRVFDSCSCQCVSGSPILIDTLGDGFALTDAAAGADFDLNGDGTPERLSWTRAASDDMWLALDRNGDGLIDSGRELFGNFTSQPDPPPGQEKQGFLALAEFDKAAAGGNSDGEINRQDTIFDSLRLWQDSNHDGVSQAHELKSLKGLGLKSIDLDYKKSKRVDEHGNEFRYRAKVKDKNDARLGRWAWDMFLVSGQ